MKFKILFGLFVAAFSGCQSAPLKPEARDRMETFFFYDLPPIEGTNLVLGGFSGLVFERFSSFHGEYDFTTLTDRGPNLEVRKDVSKIPLRPFVAPGFAPRFVQFSFKPDAHKLSRVDEMPMKGFDGKPLTGIPNIAGLDETPIDKQGHRLTLDKLGVDTEGLARDPDDGSYWACEEYRPSILHFDKDAKLLQRWIPKDTATGTGVPQLPKWYVHRQMNNGFEGIAIDGDRVTVFLQSPLVDDSEVTRVLSVDKKTGEPRAEYAYPFEMKEEGRGRVDKLGDAVNIGVGRYLVIEQNSRTDESGIHRVYEIDVNDATNLLSKNGATLARDSICIEELPKADCIQPVKKKLIVDLVALGLKGYDKMEGLAVIDANTLALVNDNDFDVMKSGNPSAFFLVHLAQALTLR